MFSMAGYYDYQIVEESVAKEDFFVHCCGHYKLITRKDFYTERPKGSANYQLLYIADGSAKFKIKGKLMEINKGTCVLYHPGEPQYYYYQLEQHPDVYWVHFTCDRNHPLMNHIDFGDGNIFEVGVHNSYALLYDKMIHELQMKDLYFEETASLYLQELLLKMSRIRNKKTEIVYKYNHQIEEAIRIFHRNPEENIVIKKYAKENNLNYYHFIDNFTKYTGLAPKQYIINIRMAKAKELLSNSLFSVTDVSGMVGYDNPLYFSRLFKKVVGMAPSEYRKVVL